MFNLVQLIITERARVTESCESCMDLILVSDSDRITQSGVISTGISDHMMTFCTRKMVKCAIGLHSTVRI